MGLRFDLKLNRWLLVEAIESQIIRLMARVRLRLVGGSWTSSRNAIVDPGSPYCIIPHSLWSLAEHRILAPHPLPLGGVGGGAVTALFGEVTLVVHDDVAVSPLTIRAYLLSDDSEPLLLGFADFLTKVVLHCDYPKHEAYVEFRA